MLRWMVAWFKKYIPITTYSRWAGWDDMRSSIRQQLDNMGIDAWMLEWAQKISTQWWVEILHEYLVWWEWFDMNTWDEVYVVVLANANKDILWIAYKSREELWTETYDNLRNAFVMAETDMTDAIWSMCMSWFYTTLIVTTSQWMITIDDGNQSIIFDSATQYMKYWTNGLWTQDTNTEYATLVANWWLTNGTYWPYDVDSQEGIARESVTNSIKNKSEIAATITTTQESWYTLISDWTDWMELKTSPTALRYHADYYAESSDVSTEYSTITTNWWDIVWTYNYTSVDNKKTVFDGLIASLKTKWIANATITHDAVNWEITMTNGQRSITMADKNLWATTVYSDWDTLSEANCGKYYQRWNNYWFPRTWTISDTSSTKVNVNNYWPGNYYSSSTFITYNGDWASPVNHNLRWDTANTDYARQWPCPSGYHIPSKDEWGKVEDMYKIIRPNATGLNYFRTAFKMPLSGCRNATSASAENQGYYGYYWTSTPRVEYDWTSYEEQIWNGNYQRSIKSRAYWEVIRPFKNTYTLIPINNLWTWDETSTAALMNQHPYDYYLLWWCTTPLTLASWAWAMRRVYASYDTNTNTWSVMEVS